MKVSTFYVNIKILTLFILSNTLYKNKLLNLGYFKNLTLTILGKAYQTLIKSGKKKAKFVKNSNFLQK